jgi:hypothetical protein
VGICFSEITFDKHRELPPHPNVVQLLGISLDGPQLVIVLEYCAGGIKSKQNKSHHNSSFDCEENFINSQFLIF